MIMSVHIVPNDKGNPPGKLADAELHFHRDSAALDGLKLIGFSIWERRGGNGRNVTFPARQYAVNGERRSFALLRPIADTDAQTRVRELILEAYAAYEEGELPQLGAKDSACKQFGHRMSDDGAYCKSCGATSGEGAAARK